MGRTLLRSFVVVATTCACVAVLASPASATAVTSSFTGGTISVSKTGQTPFSIPLGVAGSFCGSDADMDLTVAAPNSTTSDSGNGTVGFTSLTSTTRFTRGTTHFVAVITRISGAAGNFNGAGVDIHPTSSTNLDTITSVGVAIRIQLYTATNTSSTATDCAGTTGTPVCTWTANVVASGTYPHGGTSSNPQTSDTMTLAAPPAQLNPGGACNNPFGGYALGNMTISGWGVHIDSIP